ncbi:MAG: hypothetical protein Q9217_004843 [Psora testacea]
MAFPPPSDNAYSPTILLLSLPPSILCGIDLLSFTTSPKFHGIKDLPKGFHFLFTSETSSFSIRDGFWFNVSAPSPSKLPTLIVRKWNAETSSTAPVETLESYRSKVRELWEKGLSPYRQSAAREAEAGSRDWEGLTSHITPQVLSHLTQSTQWSITSASCATDDRDDIPGLDGGETGFEERELGVLGIDLKRTWREGAVGRERTDAATDRSWALQEVVRRWQGDEGEWGNVILGQMEACFVMVLTIANYSCLEEWKRCLGLVLTCKKAVKEHEEFFAAFLVLLRRQIERCEDVDGGLFDMSDEGGSLLKGWLKTFKRTLAQISSGGEEVNVKDEMEELEETLKRMYKWELSDEFVRRGMLDLEDGETVEMEVVGMDGEDESGEYAPVVVDLENP